MMERLRFILILYGLAYAHKTSVFAFILCSYDFMHIEYMHLPITLLPSSLSYRGKFWQGKPLVN